eukprot:12940297-Ditylum_brightwellii.AAC.1
MRQDMMLRRLKTKVIEVKVVTLSNMDREEEGQVDAPLVEQKGVSLNLDIISSVFELDIMDTLMVHWKVVLWNCHVIELYNVMHRDVVGEVRRSHVGDYVVFAGGVDKDVIKVFQKKCPMMDMLTFKVLKGELFWLEWKKT